MNFDQILTKSAQILIIYVKKHQTHVENFQKCHFLKIKKSNVKNQPGFWVLGYWGEIGVFWGGGIN